MHFSGITQSITFTVLWKQWTEWRRLHWAVLMRLFEGLRLSTENVLFSALPSPISHYIFHWLTLVSNSTLEYIYSTTENRFELFLIPLPLFLPVSLIPRHYFSLKTIRPYKRRKLEKRSGCQIPRAKWLLYLAMLLLKFSRTKIKGWKRIIGPSPVNISEFSNLWKHAKNLLPL